MSQGSGKREVRKLQTRLQLLDSGTEMLNDLDNRLEDLDIAKLTHSAGRTIGAFYGHWDSKRDFQLDLGRHLLSADFDINYSSLSGSLDKEAGSTIHSWTENYFESLRSSRLIIPRLIVLEGIERAAGEKRAQAREVVSSYYKRSAESVAGSLDRVGVTVQAEAADAFIYFTEDALKRCFKGMLKNEVAVEFLGNALYR